MRIATGGDRPRDSSSAAPFERRSWRSLAQLAAAILALQLVFWLGLRPLLFTVPHLPPVYAISDVQAATLDAPTLEGLSRASFAPAELPWTACCEPGYRALRFSLEIPEIPEGGVALVPNVDADNLRVYVNGAAVVASGKMTLPNTSYDANIKSILFVSSGVFHQGANMVDIVMVRATLPYFDVGKPIFAAYDEAWPRLRLRNFILNEYEILAGGIGAVLALIALVLVVRSTAKDLPVWFLILTASWALLVLHYKWTDPPLSPDGRLVYYFSLTNLVALAWLNFADTWSGRTKVWIRNASVSAFVLAMLGCAFALYALPRPTGFDVASEIANYFGLAMAAAAIARFLWHLIRWPDDRVWEVAVFALLITLMAVDKLSELFWQTNAGNLIQSLPILLLAFMVAFLARNMRLFQSMNEINTMLGARLREREAELAEQHRRENDLTRREAHQNERQRIMRDMHDGLGSHLMSMLLAARRGNAQPERVAEGLQTVIDELRLMIDSMDSAGDSLHVALAAFRTRTEQRVTAAGVGFEWRSDPDTVLPSYGPRDILQIIRILQEAVTNALKHSECRTVSISVDAASDPAYPLVIRVRDNGKGLSAEARAGRGLQNMETRAKGIGARVSVSTTPNGANVELELPASSSAEAAMIET